MTVVTMPSGCATCKKSIVGHDKKSLKGLSFHYDCFKCHDCGVVRLPLLYHFSFEFLDVSLLYSVV